MLIRTGRSIVVRQAKLAVYMEIYMKEYVFDTGDYQLKYRMASEGVIITGYQGFSWAAEVPEQIDGQLVRTVDRKAFLSKKNLREIHLPAGVESIGDWAFAYCSNLERVTIPGCCSNLGKAVFLDCEQLQCVMGICQSGCKQEAWSRENGRLLAAAVTQMEAYYLLEPAMVGSQEWLRKWDARLEAVMLAEDQEGYFKQVLCGEEDYGSTDLNAYLQAKRQKKVRLAMLRLLCEEGLTAGFRQQLAKYLTTHTLGCESEESWQVICKDGETNPEYVQLFLKLGCATRENIGEMLRRMGEDQPQMRAAFLRYQQEKLGYTDFFADLSL